MRLPLWIKQGLLWGLFMYIFMVLFDPLFFNEPLSTRKMLIGIPVWLIGGLFFGYLLKVATPSKKD